MVAYAADGQALGNDGFARIVAPGDKAGGQFVSNIVGSGRCRVPCGMPPLLKLKSERSSAAVPLPWHRQIVVTEPTEGLS